MTPTAGWNKIALQIPLSLCYICFIGGHANAALNINLMVPQAAALASMYSTEYIATHLQLIQTRERPE